MLRGVWRWWNGFAPRFVRFGFVGAAGFMVDLGTVYATRRWLGLYGAGMLSFLLAASCNFLLNRTWTFADRPRRPIGRQWLLFMLAILPGLVFNRGSYVALIATSRGLPAPPGDRHRRRVVRGHDRQLQHGEPHRFHRGLTPGWALHTGGRLTAIAHPRTGHDGAGARPFLRVLGAVLRGIGGRAGASVCTMARGAGRRRLRARRVFSKAGRWWWTCRTCPARART